MKVAFPRISGAVLAGGHGTRLGQGEKAQVELGGRTLLARVLEALRPLFRDLMVVTPRPEALENLVPGCRAVRDRHPEAGPLAGIHAALEEARCPRVFVTACDLPFLDPRVVRVVAGRAGQAEVILPRLEDRDQTLHALWDRSLARAAGRILAAGGGSPRDLAAEATVLRLDAAAFKAVEGWRRSFWSINTPEDLERARREAAPHPREEPGPP